MKGPPKGIEGNPWVNPLIQFLKFIILNFHLTTVPEWYP